MRKRVAHIVHMVRRLQRERARILAVLLVDEPLLKGSLSLVKRTCGKASCHCADRPAHDVWVLATTEDLRRRCQVVRVADVQEVQGRLAIYRDFRKELRRLDAIAKEEKRLLRGLLDKRHVPYE
jgi:hypothetical protein